MSGVSLDFPLILVILVGGSGLIWLLDALFLAPARRRAIPACDPEVPRVDEGEVVRRKGGLAQQKGLVGAGISVYTAFFAFGAVRLMPELALNPVLWSVPLITGLAIILYHWRRIGLQQRRATQTAEVA